MTILLWFFIIGIGMVVFSIGAGLGAKIVDSTFNFIRGISWSL